MLPEEAALRLGYPASSKPVNVVLKPSYAAVTGELEDRVTTRGLRNDFNTELNAVRIAGDNRMTLDLQYQIGDAISEAKRGVVRPLGAMAASAAGLVSDPAGGTVGATGLAVLGVPAQGRTAADFAAEAALDTTGSLRTLVPQTSQFTANGSFARAIGAAMTVTIGGRFDHIVADDRLGPAIADVVISSSTGNPFGEPVRLRRVLPDQPAVLRRTTVDTFHLGGLLAGYGAWQWSAGVNYDRLDQTRNRRGGIDASALQSAISAGALADPFAPPPAALIAPAPTRHSASRDETLAADLFASTPLAPFQGGEIALTLRGSLGHERLTADKDGLSGRLARDHFGGLVSLDVPLLPEGSAIGALDGNLNAAADHYSDAGSTRGWGASLAWKPAGKLSLLVAAARDQAVPGVSALGGPIEVTPDAAFYDFTTARSLVAARIDGGDPALRPDTRQILKGELTWKPRAGMTLNAAWTTSRDRDVLLGFPGITSAALAALPGRIQRGGSGAIVTIDTRPFNADRETRDEVKLGFSFGRNFGKGKGPRVPGGGGFGGGHSFGAQGRMIQFSLTDTIRLRDDLRLSPGGAAIDLVRSNALGDVLRVPRQRVEAQLSGTANGLGLRANAVWSSGGSAGAGDPGALRFADRFTFNFRLFWFPASSERVAARAPWLKGVRFLLAVDNLFDTWQRVEDPAGRVPLAYQRGLLDPIGRTVRLSIRKTLD